eukprot:scaffold144376_cov555-Phaeocystis_antarctica.AAC.1
MSFARSISCSCSYAASLASLPLTQTPRMSYFSGTPNWRKASASLSKGSPRWSAIAHATMLVDGGRPRSLKIGGCTGAFFISSMRLSAAARSTAVGRLEVARKGSRYEPVRCSGRRALLRCPEPPSSSAI